MICVGKAVQIRRNLNSTFGEPTMTCRMCSERTKNWNGADPKCSFPSGGAFTPDGWNCATTNAVREISGQDEPHPLADYRYCDDQNYSTIKIDGIDLPSGPALALWVSWYKHRGRTEAMWLLSQDNPPRLPTAADCEAIIALAATAATTD